MNNSLIKTFFSLFLVFLLTGCDKLKEREITLGLNEVFVYYDSEIDDFKVLSQGTHRIILDYAYSKFSLEDLKIQESIRVITSDKKEVSIDLTYWYAFKKKNVIQIHKKYTGQVEESLILPTIRSVVRNEMGNIVSDSIHNEQLRLSLLANIANLKEYSELIDSKSFIITELSLVDQK